ncbi:tubulin-specific chaperone E [Dermacentor silvarum]|uniref:tubulin-specific chaperone E n=1 Tax=Dermacentor silvarum TaxID=543639 RepID=UPI001898BD14|nr:tubulin-specific chaperone E [Dermacentor silvarum]
MGEQLEEVAVGTRVSCDGHYGVVRYCGPVVDTKGTWLGIEWEDPYRGKHNGCHNGVQYFQTRSETGGSFIRPQKVERTLSVADAVREKYFSTLSDLEAPSLSEDQDVLLLQFTPNRTVQFVGPEKITAILSRGETIREVVLANMPVDRPGNDGELAGLVPKLQCLVLTHTMLSTWEQVAQITRQLPYLSELHLSKNMLEIPKEPAELRDYFRSVRQMVLRGVGYSWDQALQCAEMWPWVENLVLSLNGISVLRPPPEMLFQQLERLSLQDNPISSWETVCHLGHLPRLKSLSLADCDLTSISFPDTPPGQKTPLFANLVILNLHNNRLEEWVSIAELNKLARLEDLFVKGNPVTVRERRHISRCLLVAHLGNLQLLDRMAVTRDERREAGIYYVNRFFPLWVQCGGTAEGGTPSPEFLREHPRFLSLLKTYGAPETVPDGKTSSLNKRVITVEIHAPQEPDRGPIRKRLPLSMSVEKLKALVMQLFPRKGSRFCLSLASLEEGKESVLDKERRDLSFYDITDGSRIYVRW